MERELVEVFITHVEDDGPLLKLWAQIDRKTPSLIERTIDQLTAQFEQGVGIPEPHTLTVGQLCCAKYSDGIYYRARITSLANLSNSEVSVQFADYGNLETIALQNMRSFEGLLTVLSTIADQAMDFYLAGVVPTSGEWTPRSLKFVKDIICYVDLKCVYVGHTEGVRKQLIKLFYQNMDFAIYLIERGVCVTILLATQISLLQSIVNHKALPPLQLWPRYNPDIPPPLPMSSLMVTASMAKACEKNLVESVAMNRSVYAPPGLASQPPPGMHPSMNYPVHPPPGMVQHEYPTYSDAYRPNHMQQRQTPPLQLMQRPPPLPQVEVAASFETPHLEVNSRHEVRIAFVEDGPNSFVVFLKNMEKVLGDMLSDINSKPATPLKKLPMIGSICLGKYSRDQSLCRAVVTNVLADSCVVAYVDFGHSETLPYSEIFELPQKYIKNPCVMAVRFSHARLPGFEITPEVKRLFKECVVNKYLTLCVVPSEGHRLQQYGVLIDGGRLVLETVREMTEARKISDYTRITSLHKGSTKPILVSFVESVNSFYVQIEDSAEALTALMSDVLAHCEGDARKLDAADVQNGLLCCARFAEDGQWYRAQITKMAKDGIFVNYVDYGNTEAVQLDALREIKVELVTCLKAQAVRCCLKNFKDAPASDELIDVFSELTADKNLIMMVGEVDQSGCLIVELHDLTSSPPVILSNELQKCVKRVVHEKTNQQPDQPYRPPTGSSNEYSEPKPVAESRPIERGGGDYKNQQQGSRFSRQNERREQTRPSRDFEARTYGKKRAEATSDWRAKGDERSVRPRQSGDAPDRWPRDEKIDTWEGSSENRAGAAKLVPSQVPPGGTRTAQLIYAENPEDFYVQLTPDSALTDLMADIAAVHEGGAGRPMRQVARGAACIAKFSEDDTWYRANVLSVDDDKAKVQFVDYGNSDFVALQNVREISSDFVKFPAQAVKCSLKDALPKGSNWSDDEINDFVLSIDGKPLEVKFISEKNGLYAVVVKDVETRKIVNEDFGAPAEAPAYRAPAEPPVHRAPAEKPVYRAAQPELPPKPKPPPPPQKPMQHFVGPDERFFYQEFQPGTVEKVNVCWFTSPENFYVQCTSQASLLDKTMRDIQMAYVGTPPNTDDLVDGSPIVAKYLGDNSLCRAEVTSTKGPTTYAVRFVDYGNCDLVAKRNMWRVDKRFVDLPKQAVLCTLPDLLPVDAEWPKSKDLDALFQAEEYECTFIGWLDGKYHVSLVHKGASVADELVAKGLARLPVFEPEIVAAEATNIEEPIKFELFLGQTLKVVMPYVESIAKFYVHLEGNLSEVVQALVDEYVLTPENLVALPTGRVKVGQLCLATSDGAQWYRARIVDPAGTAGIYVVFVDYGDGDELTADKLMTIPEYLSTYPAQAIECSLSGWESTAVGLELEDVFKANNEGETAIIHVDSVDQERLSVTVFTLACKKQELVDHIGKGLKEVGLIRPLPILAQKPVVCVSHAASPWSIWLQKLSDLDLLTEQLSLMFTFYEEESRGADVGVVQDLFCAAKSPTDGQWYRAKVEEFKLDAVVSVRFVDYGNCEDVKQPDVKALDSAFCGHHAFAVETMLLVRQDNITDIDLIDVATMTLDVEYLAVFTRVMGADIWCAELFNNKETLSGKLVEMGLQFVEDYPFEKYVEELTKSPKLVPGMTLQAYVSHPGNPKEFWIQHADNSEVIDLFQASLQEAADTLEDLLDPAVDGLCLAQFSEDGSWYRATILEVAETVATVRFVDYGNTDVVDTTANPLKSLTYTFSKVERYAVKCSLNVAPIDAEFTEEAIERFSALVASTEDSLLVQVIAEGNVIDLWHGDVSFVATLIAEDHAGERYDENSVFVSHVNSPAEFWIQYQSATRQLDTMAERLLEAAAFEALESCDEGVLCAAQFADDELWYRARVIGKVDDATAVHFVDYGNASVSSEVRTLPADLLAEAPLAKRCSLATEHETLWTDEATGDFTERVAEGATSFLVKIDAEGDPMLVTLTDLSKVIVNEVLAELAVVITEGSKAVSEDKTVDSDVVTKPTDENVDDSKSVGEAMEDTMSVDEALDDTVPVEAVEVAKLVDEAAKDTVPLEETVDTETAESVVTDLSAKLTKDVVEEDACEGKLNIVFEANLTTKEMMEEMLEKIKIEDESTHDLVESDAASSVETVSDRKSSTDGAALELVKSVAELSVGKESGAEVKDISVESPPENEAGSEEKGGDVATLDVGVEESAGIEDAARAGENAGSEGLSEAKTLADVKWKAVVEKSFTEQALDDETFLSAEESDTSTLEDFKSPEKLASPEQPLTDKSGNDIPAPESINDLEEDLKSTNVAVCASTPAHVSAPVSRPMTPHNERIVPGSVCRGVSQEELEKYKFDPEVDGRDLARSDDEEEEEEAVQAKSCPATPVPREMLRAASSCEDCVASPVRLKHSERIVPGSISSGSSLEEMVEVAVVSNGDRGLRDAEDENIEIAKGIVRLVIEQSEASVMSQVKDSGDKGHVMENGSMDEPAEREVTNGDASVVNDSEIHKAV